MTAPVTGPTALSENAGLIPKSGYSDHIATHHPSEVHTRTGENTTKIWLKATTPLILHTISVLILTTVLKSYIDDHDFNLHSRKALVKYTPLQSDITTAISSCIAISRLFATIWSASTIWRCIFILMERGGITLGHIESLLTWQIHLHPRLKSSQGTQVGFLISIILLASFPCQLSGPILTGSITWSPSSNFAKDQTTAKIGPGYTGHLSDDPFNSIFPPNYSAPGFYSLCRQMASGAAIIAWQESQDDERTMKRVLRPDLVGRLPINSTLGNVTLPYFAVTKLEWISDPMKEFPQVVLNSYRNVSRWNPFHSSDFIGTALGTFAMIPDTWGIPPSLYAGTVSETRILVGTYGFSNGNHCNASIPFGDMPPNITLLSDSKGCYIYGRVTYVAGAAECKDCRVSSWNTVQNDTNLTVSPSVATMQALGMMPSVAGMMATQNASLPRAFNNLDGYVTDLLIRSYATSWSILMEGMSSSRNVLVTNVRIAVPTSRANVLWWRIWLWLLLNVMFTLSGLLFLVIQSRCSQPMIGSPSMAAFLLDTTEVLHKRDRALCSFSMLLEDDKDIGSLHLPRNTMDGTHKRVEVVEDWKMDQSEWF